MQYSHTIQVQYCTRLIISNIPYQWSSTSVPNPMPFYNPDLWRQDHFLRYKFFIHQVVNCTIIAPHVNNDNTNRLQTRQPMACVSQWFDRTMEIYRRLITSHHHYGWWVRRIYTQNHIDTLHPRRTAMSGAKSDLWFMIIIDLISGNGIV